MPPNVLSALTANHDALAHEIPTIAIPLFSQLSPTPLAALNGVFPLLVGTNTTAPVIRIPPAWSFSIGWLPDTFNASYSDELFYWAVQDDGLPIPSWLQFDNTTLTFFGTTPNISRAVTELSTKSTPITLYSGLVLGDDAVAALANFTLQVSNNNLFLSKQLPVIETIASSNISFALQEPLLSALECIHGSVGNIGIHAETDTSGEDWLWWDSRLMVLSGEVRAQDIQGRNITLPVTITDSIGPDTAHSSLIIKILPYPFVTLKFPNITISPGADFNISIANYITANNPFFHTYSIATPSYGWLNIDSASLQMHGVAPLRGPLTNEIAVNVSASGSSDITTSSVFFLIVKANSVDTSPASTVNSHKSLIALIVAIPFLVCGCIAFCWRGARARFHLRTDAASVEETTRRRPTDADGRMTPQTQVPFLCSEEAGSRFAAETFRIRPLYHASTHSVKAVEVICASNAHICPSLVLERIVDTSGETGAEQNWDDVARMPSMNFTMLILPPEAAASREWNGKQDSGHNSDQGAFCQDVWDAAQQSQRARSVNSAYDSLPSWDSESTWHYERRRRPPSPAWRRGDVDRGTTLYDVLHKEADMLQMDGIE